MIPRKIEASPRLERLIARRDSLALSGKRNLYMDNALHGVYQWSKGSASFAPITGAQAASVTERVCLGDHNCRVGSDAPFPLAAEMPSRRHGLQHRPLNWAQDYSFFLKNSPAVIHPEEKIVGEFHWQLDEARAQRYPDYLDEYGERAKALGAGGSSQAHTCPDLSVGLKLGWGGILKKIKERQAFYAGDKEKSEYLEAAELSGLAIVAYIEKHAELALALGNIELKDLCQRIALEPPQTLREALQWIQFYQLVERIVAHGNGYGRLDLLLTPYYRADLAAGRLTPQEAVNLIAELYLKYGGNYFSLGGRGSDGQDATNEVSWLCLQAYDMVGGYNCLGVLWHHHIESEFYQYACEVVARHGCATPALLNYDKMRESELESGVKPEDAWNLSYSGCQWYSLVGKEYCDQDKNVLVLIECFLKTLRQAAQEPPADYEAFYARFLKGVEAAAEALLALKNLQYLHQPLVWPEIPTSLLTPCCLEQGVDITRPCQGLYGFTSVNFLGFTNVVDSLRALQEVVFGQNKVSLPLLVKALDSNFLSFETLRQWLLEVPKFGSDESYSNQIAARLSSDLASLLGKKRNVKGYPMRGSLFHFLGHAIAGPLLGASPDGRFAGEPFAQGMNPQHGRGPFDFSQVGASLLAIDQKKHIGAPWQCELDRSFFRNCDQPGELLASLSDGYFKAGGLHINFNITTLAELKAAVDCPEHYPNLVVKVTGYSAHFVKLSSHYQNDIIQRSRITV